MYASSLLNPLLFFFERKVYLIKRRLFRVWMKTCLSAVYDKLKPILLSKRKNPSSAKYKNLAQRLEKAYCWLSISHLQRPLHFFTPTLSLSLMIIIFFLIIWQQFILELQQNQTQTDDQSLNLHKETSGQKYVSKYMIWFIIHRHFDFEAMKACEINFVTTDNNVWCEQFSYKYCLTYCVLS